MIPHPVCFSRWLYRSIRCMANVDGHNFAIGQEPTPPNIQVLRCRTCGDSRVVWDWGSLVDRTPNISPAVPPAGRQD